MPFGTKSTACEVMQKGGITDFPTDKSSLQGFQRVKVVNHSKPAFQSRKPGCRVMNAESNLFRLHGSDCPDIQWANIEGFNEAYL